MVQIKELPQVGFKEAAINAFKKMFQFKGRIRRSEYWWGYLVLMICYFVVNLIPIIGQIVACFIMIACISMLFRRLHDTGRSGWWWGIAALLMIGIDSSSSESYLLKKLWMRHRTTTLWPSQRQLPMDSAKILPQESAC